MKRLLPLVLISFLFSFTNSYAQLTSCAQTLRLARSVYEQGRLHEIQELLKKCLESGFTKEEKIEAYKILALSYIYLEEPANADAAMLQILRLDPEYIINESVDPAEFIALYNSFRTTPIYSLGLKIAPSYNWLHTVASNSAGSGYSENSPQLGFEAGVVSEIPITKKISISAELLFKTCKVSTEHKGLLVDEDGNTLSDVEQVQTFGSIKLPVNVSLFLMNKKYKPYLSLGITPEYILSSNMTITRFITNYAPVTERSFDAKELINPFLLSANIAAGAKYKIKRGYLYGEVRFNYGLTQLTKSDAIYTAIPELSFAYAYPANINKLNSISLTFGYLRNQYNPKKKK